MIVLQSLDTTLKWSCRKGNLPSPVQARQIGSEKAPLACLGRYQKWNMYCDCMHVHRLGPPIISCTCRDLVLVSISSLPSFLLHVPLSGHRVEQQGLLPLSNINAIPAMFRYLTDALLIACAFSTIAYAASNGSRVLPNGKYEIQSEGIRAQFIPYAATVTNLFITDIHGVE